MTPVKAVAPEKAGSLDFLASDVKTFESRILQHKYTHFKNTFGYANAL
jgi:hypothetical protein